jgi:DNA-binding response OmpR family regulator
MLQDRILIADSSAEVCDFLANQVLANPNFVVQIAQDGTAALQALLTFIPDVLLTSLDLPGLRGKDLLAAIRAQELETSAIVLVEEHTTTFALDAFRLGAVDYLAKPLREAEVITAVDRALENIRGRRERAEMHQQLEATNLELEQRVRELTALMAVGKNVTQFRDPAELYQILVDAAVSVTNSDCGWLLLRNEQTQQLQLTASLRLPEALAVNIGDVWNGGVEANILSAKRGLNVTGPSLNRVAVGKFARSIAGVPVLVRDDAVGVLMVARREMVSFASREILLLQGIADYAATAVVNARLFTTLGVRAKLLQSANAQLQADDHERTQFLRRVGTVLQTPLTQAQTHLNLAINLMDAQTPPAQREALLTAQMQMQLVLQAVNQLLESASQP